MERAELIALLRNTGCAEERGGDIFLCDPRWTKTEREHFDAQRNAGIADRRAQRFIGREAESRESRAESRNLRPASGSDPETRNSEPETGNSNGAESGESRAESKNLRAASGSDPETRNSEPETRDPEPKTQNPKLKTPNPKPETASPASGWLCIPTGGTSGTLRFARHDEATLGAAARGFLEHFRLGRVNAIDVLPAFHVSGLMARVRCAVSGGKHVAWDWKTLEAGNWPSLDGDDWVISLVPTQLQRLLESSAATDWLRRFRIIFVGGGPTWPALTDRAAEARLNLSLSYGMTETAAMIAAQRPEEFLAGDRSAGSALPHAAIAVEPDGAIAVTGPSVFRGYWPERSAARSFRTEDLGRIDSGGRLNVLGRSDAVIISGGEKINPLEVEAVLHATGEFSDVAVLGMSDPQWGQRVVACYAARHGRAPNFERVQRAVAEQLVAYKRPKDYLAIADWPRNAQGKLSRRELANYLAR